MTPTAIPDRPASQRDVQEAIKDAVEELQLAAGGGIASAIKSAVVSGAGAATNIAVAGIAVADDIISVIQFNITTDSGTSATGNKVDDVTDRTSEATVTSAGNIQLSTTVTTGDKLLVLYLDLTP